MWREKPLSFLGQVRLAELARPDFEPTSEGLLAFFYEADGQEAWGFDPGDRGAWRVVNVRDFDSAAERVAPAGALTFPTRGVDAAEEYTAPDPWEPAFVDVFNPEEEIYANLPELDKLWELAKFGICDTRATGGPIHQAFGWPEVIQSPMQLDVQLAANGIYVGEPEGYDDPRVELLAPSANDWRLFLQLDSDDDLGWMWGDVGRLYFWIRDADLRAGRYESTWCVLQCS
jgi:uncharacterized protein YwqG